VNVQPTNDEVDGIFARYAEPGSPGCALAVMVDGEIAYKQGYGLANLEHEVPILPSTVFNIGSMAKQFTGFAIALLEAEGKLSLDDDMCRYLPEMHDFGEPIRIHHLIHHTSGLRGSFPELLALAEWRDTDATTTEDVFWLLKAQRELNYRPGEEFLYVNSNYVLLARICERASGQSFGAFCQERIFEPLGMTRSVINDSLLKVIPGRALGYYEDDEEAWAYAPLTDCVVGPTNVYTTVEDLARWDENFYTGAVGGRAVVERMQEPGRLNDSTVLDYAFGLEVGPAHQHRGWQVVEHGGGQGGYGSWMMRFPEKHLSVVVLFNHFLWEMREYAIQVADLFLEARGGAAVNVPEGMPAEQAAAGAIELSAGQLEKKAGIYFNGVRATLREVTYEEGRLRYQGLDLMPVSETLFAFERAPDTQVAFVPATDDAPARMRTITPSGEYDYDRVEAVSPSAEDLQGYAGRYYSPELDIVWTVVAADDHLVAKRRKYVDSELRPLFVDGFSDDWGPLMGYPTTYLVVFERDEAGAVAGLRVSGTRVRNLWCGRQGGEGPGIGD
jgi:CubicO group peptidase (beta-lactamase class C family)